jgi:hypothetical protein
VITGGGSGIINATDVARAVLRLPSSISSVGALARSATVDATWAVAYGLCRWAYAEDQTDQGHSFMDVFSGGWDSVKNLFKSLLP